MKRSSDKTVAAGLPAWPKLRSRWLRTILAGTALALATTALAPTASADIAKYGITTACEPEDKVCEARSEAARQSFMEHCEKDGGAVSNYGGGGGMLTTRCVFQE